METLPALADLALIIGMVAGCIAFGIALYRDTDLSENEICVNACRRHNRASAIKRSKTRAAAALTTH